MLLEKISNFETVQFILIVAFALVVCAAMALRRARQSEELKSQDQRQKDAVATQISVGRGVAEISRKPKTVLDNGGE